MCRRGSRRCGSPPWDRLDARFATGELSEAASVRGDSPRADITYLPNGDIEPGPEFKSREHAWYEGLAAMARGGVPLILDEVFLAGAAAQASLGARLQGLQVLWVGIRCDPAVAAAREAQRRDRIPGMAAQAGAQRARRSELRLRG